MSVLRQISDTHFGTEKPHDVKALVTPGKPATNGCGDAVQ